MAEIHDENAVPFQQRSIRPEKRVLQSTTPLGSSGLSEIVKPGRGVSKPAGSKRKALSNISNNIQSVSSVATDSLLKPAVITSKHASKEPSQIVIVPAAEADDYDPELDVSEILCTRMAPQTDPFEVALCIAREKYKGRTWESFGSSLRREPLTMEFAEVMSFEEIKREIELNEAWRAEQNAVFTADTPLTCPILYPIEVPAFLTSDDEGS